MCESNGAEKGFEELKQAVHSQHARILKEDDEIWISSEDLNTENSSDEDRSKVKLAFRKKLKPKNRKRSSPNIRLQRPSIPSVTSTSQQLDNRLLMPQTSEDPHSRSTDESRTSDEEYNVPSMISSECLSKRLSLEDWRPTRGSLTVSSLEETASAAGDPRKLVNETGNFLEAMMNKLKTLKSCSALSPYKEPEDLVMPSYKKTFKYLKNTPEVKRSLEAIRAMDEEIFQTINQYKEERQERLSTEFDVCKDIVEHKVAEEHGTEAFLQMSGFDKKLKKLVQINEKNRGNNEKIMKKIKGDGSSKAGVSTSSGHMPNFIERNRQGAKAGTMAYFALTDEEKARIEKLMEDFEKDIDNYNLNDAELRLSSMDFTEEINENAPIQKSNFIEEKNGFLLDDDDKNRLESIDKELEKFVKDEQSKECRQIAPIPNEEYWKIDNLNNSLRKIEKKLEALQASKDEEKLQTIAGNLKENDYKEKLKEIIARGLEDENSNEENYDYKEKLKQMEAKWLQEEKLKNTDDPDELNDKEC
ncbi:uncharacterized protein LOC126735745 [Anthonomus grandis grandis]|uniref:uncharacterized protein LOC126735745 n=1 Tax=Anthonomus grandis grandis TaxID=2921223 RepID=UPI0021659C6F|nr:uncharacterized protein LOC126735745 [Anthonomus grandis grandis]